MNIKNIHFEIKKLATAEVSAFFKAHDNDYFEKLSDRIDIDAYSQKVHKYAIHFTLNDGDTLVGFSPCYFNHETSTKSYISSLTIREGYRRAKLGSRLLDHIKEYATKQEVTELIVGVHCRNKCSINFYKNNDFSLCKKEGKTESCSLHYLNKKIYKNTESNNIKYASAEQPKRINP